MREEWKPILRGDYMISNYGRLYSNYRIVSFGRGRRICGGRILSPQNHSAGYLAYPVGHGRTQLAHRLVAEAFLEKQPGKPNVNHLDGNKKNNIVSNLEWASQAENISHAYENGLNSRRRAVVCVETGDVYESLAAAARAMGQSAGSLDHMLAGRRPTFAGYTWRYAK